jgi:zinc transporter
MATPEAPATEDGGLVHALVLDGKGGAETLDWDGVERWKAEDGVLWLNLDYAGADTQAWLGMRSGIDPVLREALLDQDPRPRALAVADSVLLIVRAVNLNQGAEPEDMVSLRCWIEARRVITLRHRLVRAAKGIASDLHKGTGPRTGGELTTEIVERILEPVVRCVDGLDDEVAEVEHDALGEHDLALRTRIATLRRRAISLRRFVAPQRDAFARLAAMSPSWLGEHDRARLREAADRLTRTVEELDAARDRAGVTHEELATRLGEVSNKRLYVLSLMTAIFLPLGFVTSLLGVNVGGVPAQDVAWGFWALCGLFSVAVVIQLWLFKKWKWL